MLGQRSTNRATTTAVRSIFKHTSSKHFFVGEVLYSSKHSEVKRRLAVHSFIHVFIDM